MLVVIHQESKSQMQVELLFLLFINLLYSLLGLSRVILLEVKISARLAKELLLLQNEGVRLFCLCLWIGMSKWSPL